LQERDGDRFCIAATLIGAGGVMICYDGDFPEMARRKCSGGTNITDAWGKLLAGIGDKEGVIYADVQPADAMRIRKENCLYRGQRGDLYFYPGKKPERES
jgi:predicted amidohydrolase